MSATQPPRWLKVASPRRIECDTTPSRPTDYERDFDELVLNLRGKCWLSVEALNSTEVFVAIADRRFWLSLRGKKARIVYEEKDGETTPPVFAKTRKQKS